MRNLDLEFTKGKMCSSIWPADHDLLVDYLLRFLRQNIFVFQVMYYPSGQNDVYSCNVESASELN
jgi:hypothetical protein